MRRRSEPDRTGQELTEFFAALQDESKLTEYHADPQAYVQAQQEQGVLSAGSSQLILSGNLPDVQASIARGGLGGGAPVKVVFPPS